MHLSLEEAGLICGTEEWKEEQEEKGVYLLFKEGRTVMLEGKQLLDMLYDQPELFSQYIKNKQFSEAKKCYDDAVTLLVRLEAGRDMMAEFFGERGERGVILREGLFKEELVQKAYYEAAVRRDGGYENKKYEPWQKNSA